MTGSGLTWDDPVLLPDASGSLAFGVSDGTWRIFRWDGPYEAFANLVFQTDSQNSVYVNAWRTPPSDLTSAASVPGTNAISAHGESDPVTGYSSGFDDDGANPIWLKVRSTGAYATVTWSKLAAPPPRPYTWDTAVDLDPSIPSAPFVVEYDNVGARYGERHYTLQPAVGSQLTITFTELGDYAYVEGYIQTPAPYDGASIGYAYAKTPPVTLNWTVSGERIHLVLSPPGNMPEDGSVTGHFTVDLSPAEPPPAYTVANDLLSGAQQLTLGMAGSIAYDNTGATESDTLPPGLSSAARDIWYRAPASPTGRTLRFTTTPSDDNVARQVDMNLWGYDAATSHYPRPNYGRSANTLYVTMPANQEIVLQLSFPYGNQGVWETAGTLAWEDITDTLSADTNADTPSALPYSGVIEMPQLGSMQTLRYMQVVGDGKPINFYLGDAAGPSTLGSFNAYIAPNSGGLSDPDLQPIVVRSTNQPAAFTQIGTTPGQTVMVIFISRHGDSASFTYGVSIDEDITWTSWIDLATHVDGFTDTYDVQTFSSTNSPMVKSWSATGYQEGKTGPSGGIDPSLYPSLHEAAIEQMLTSIPPAVAGQGPGSVSSSWSTNGIIWRDPNDAGTLTQVHVSIAFGGASFRTCFDDAGRIKLVPYSGKDYGPDSYAPMFKFWSVITAQLGLPTNYTLFSIGDAFASNRLVVEWSEDLGYFDLPYRPRLRVETTSAHVSNQVTGPGGGVGMTPHPLIEATPYSDPERVGFQTAVSEAGADSFAASPNLGGGRTTLLMSAEDTFDSYAGPVEFFEDILSQLDSWFIVFSDGLTLSSRTPLDGQAMADFAVANNYGYLGLYGPTFTLSGSATTNINLNLEWPAQMRVGQYAPRFGPPPAPPAPEALRPGYSLIPSPNLDGLGDGARVTFS